MTEQAQDVQTWHKALCLVFRKLGIVEMMITDEDIEPLQEMQPDDMPAMAAISAEDGLHLILTTQREARVFQEQVSASDNSSPIILPPKG